MKWLAQLLGMVIEYLFGRWLKKTEEAAKDREIIKEEGERAEAAGNNAVSELQTPEGQSAPNPDEVPNVKKWSDYFKHRRNRKRP